MDVPDRALTRTASCSACLPLLYSRLLLGLSTYSRTSSARPRSVSETLQDSSYYHMYVREYEYLSSHAVNLDPQKSAVRPGRGPRGFPGFSMRS